MLAGCKLEFFEYFRYLGNIIDNNVMTKLLIEKQKLCLREVG